MVILNVRTYDVHYGKNKFYIVEEERRRAFVAFTASACHVRLDYLLNKSAGEVVDTARLFCYTLQRANSSDVADVKS